MKWEKWNTIWMLNDNSMVFVVPVTSPLTDLQEYHVYLNGPVGEPEVFDDLEVAKAWALTMHILTQ